MAALVALGMMVGVGGRRFGVGGTATRVAVITGDGCAMEAGSAGVRRINPSGAAAQACNRITRRGKAGKILLTLAVYHNSWNRN